MSKQALSRPPRPPRTKEMLLPLATAKVRALSLENHLALATVRAGRGDFDQICCLIRVVYLAYFMRGETAAILADAAVCMRSPDGGMHE
ncbi:hypothetical protein [Burkholderia ubonensis]|uniref:hypothetical protein n=2 Tax=Burkholderia ubonensis TaxID=101571 RepID=UPI000756E259|nr:hypothetical protein [Burkholderia ubonensis]KVD02618.1 hypothetical protein WI79_16960 [Burkholderia ubonensis]KVD70052.1 hypothetical protein WI88_04505 [Burkholderia ubonensis]OJB57900.1 hypothetical protein BGV59_00170 [Burkholderia ubonensis]OJB61385.1 hypothetical protein BGV60_05400 [Burkholderia ubonensis]